RRAAELARRGGPPAARANALLLAARLTGDDALVEEAQELLAPCPAPGAMVLERLGSSRDPVEGDDLSERELQILRLLATDLSQREIGNELYVSVNTVKTHARHIFRKLGAAGRADAVEQARQAGLLG
ncbi:MAG TPA: LuxR C-terminal-related transcriptional regulator, partial [Solirubrobacteraceae bacterium]|nr:LuxR C-terminal-related transcriptional regulator [Solirubrobacteraceae bacterium]